MIKPNNRAFARGKIGQPRSARGNAFPLWWLSPPPFPRLRGKSGEAGKGEASAASQFAGCQSSPMTLKANPVTLTLYLSSVRAIPQPSGPQGPSDLRTLRPIGPVNPKNLSPCPLSEAMHSEHILKERSDAQNVVSRFPCGDTTCRH